MLLLIQLLIQLLILAGAELSAHIVDCSLLTGHIAQAIILVAFRHWSCTRQS